VAATGRRGATESGARGYLVARLEPPKSPLFS